MDDEPAVPERILRQGLIRRFRAGATLFREGDRASGAFILLAGRCAVIEHGDRVNTIVPGELFGEIGALAGGSRTATVQTLEDVEVVFLSTDQLRDTFSSSPDLFWASLRLIVERLRTIAERQIVYRDEHKALRDVQASLLPDLAAFAQHAPFKIDAVWLPSTYASGDYYDVIRLDERRHLIAIGDVMGHGAEASLMMAIARAQIRELARSFRRTDELLLRLDGYLRDNAPPKQGMSAVVAVYDAVDGVLEYSVAGHPLPMLARAGKVAEVPGRPGILLALPFLLGTGYERHEMVLHPGDRLLFYTDGLIEVPSDEKGTLLGTLGLVQEFTTLMSTNIDAPLNTLVDAIASRAGDAAHDDDRTAILMTIPSCPH